MTNSTSKDLTSPAKRALSEAETRRKLAKKEKLPREHQGRNGPEATRFGDWEKNGIISDF